MKQGVKFLTIICFPCALLLLNDHLLKQTFSGMFTGKLSDVVGLWTWGIFFLYFFPSRSKLIAIFSSLIFIWWKSSYSQAFIDFLYSLGGIQLHRTVDYMDLWALLVFIPFSVYGKQISAIFKENKQGFNQAFLLASAFGFCATSAPDYSVYPQWTFKDQKFEIENSKRDILKATGPIKDKKGLDSLVKQIFFDLSYYDKLNSVSYDLFVSIDSLDIKKTKINLINLRSYDFGRKTHELTKSKFLKIFVNGYIRQASTLDSTLGSAYFRR